MIWLHNTRAIIKVTWSLNRPIIIDNESIHMCGRVHAATLANTATLKNYLGQGTSIHDNPTDAPLVLLHGLDDQHLLTIIICNKGFY
jgi:hypothetical protein